MALCFSEPNGSSFPNAGNFNRKIEYPGMAYAWRKAGYRDPRQPKPARSQRHLLTMTDGEGTPARSRSGERITHKLEAGEDAGTIAKRLTLRIYRQVRGDGTDFNRRLAYPKVGMA